MKTVLAFIVLVFAVADVSASISGSLACDCVYTKSGLINLFKMQPYFSGARCKPGKVPKVLEKLGKKLVCCHVPVPTTVKKTTVKKTTLAPIVVASSSSPQPQVCSLSCANGILDEANCRCCDFADFQKYANLSSQLEAIELKFKNQQPGAEILKQIEDLNLSLNDIESKVISTCGATPPDSITGFFGSAQQNLQKLTVSVSEFNFNFNPNTCQLDCNQEGGFVPVYESCECIFLQGYAELYAVRNEYSRLLGFILRSLFDTVESYDVYSYFREADISMWRVVSAFMYSWSKYSLEQKYGMIEEIIVQSQEVTLRIEAYIYRVHGSCANYCDYYYVPNGGSSCSCYNTDAIVSFYRAFEEFIRIEMAIYYWNYEGNVTARDYFINWAATIRVEAVDFYSQVTSSIFLQEQQQSVADLFIEHFRALQAAWALFAVEKTCDVVCSGDTIKKCNPCECVAVAGWEKLITIVQPDIDVILSEIDALDTELSVKTTLKSNAEKVKAAIADLLKYSESNCWNLNEGNIITAVSSLLIQYEEIKAKIVEIRSSGSSCSLSCPNNWTADLNACSCTCPSFSCTNSIPDPYNCQCADQNDCTKTQDECASSAPNTYLNYADCICVTL